MQIEIGLTASMFEGGIQKAAQQQKHRNATKEMIKPLELAEVVPLVSGAKLNR